MNINIKKDGKLIKQVLMQDKSLIIGRSSSSDIQLLDQMISRHHVRITNNKTSVTFEDMGSRNGMYFKGKKVAVKEIYPGQTLRVGNYVVSIDAVDPAAQKTIAMLEEGEGETEIALTNEDLEIGLEDHTVDAPPPVDTNPLLQTKKKQEADSFMQAIAVSDAPANLEDGDHAPETMEQQSIPQAQNPSFTDIDNAPIATLGQAIEEALDEASYVGSEPETKTNPETHVSEVSIQTKKVEQSTGDSNPLFSKEELEEVEKSAPVMFSSLQSDPHLKDNNSSRDIFSMSKQEETEDKESNIETGAFTPEPPSTSSAKTEIRNFDRVAEPKKAKKPTRKFKYKKYMFFGTAVLIAILMLFLDKDVQRNLFKGSSITKSSSKSKDETTRIVQFKIEKVKKSLTEEDLDSAKSEMKILLTEYADHPDLKEYLPVYNKTKNTLEEQISNEQAERAKQEEQITLLTQQAEKLANEKKYSASIETYQKILQIDVDNANALSGIETVESMQIQDERKEFAKKKKYQMLDRIYGQGIESYEAGEFGKAKKLFQQVTAERGHPKYKRAKNFLSKISTQTDSALNQQIEEARSKIDSTVTLPEGYKTLQSITKQFPQHKQAKEYLDIARGKMNKRAKELYAEAIAQEELAGDFSTALDLYHEVLLYAPNPEGTYHKKAKSKIEKLEF